MSQQKPVIANYKIFLLAGFVSAALITSLFVYRINHRETTDMVNDGNSMVMTVGRDLKSIDLITMHDQKFTERNLMSHWTLMFFGFSHCSNVCPVTLEMLNKAYPSLHNAIPDLQVVFVSLDPERDTKAELKKYTESFNTNFIGISGKIENVRKLQSQLGIYSALDNNATDKGGYQLQHTSSIMLISPQGKWVGMFKFGLAPDVFAKLVEGAITKVKTA